MRGSVRQAGDPVARLPMTALFNQGSGSAVWIVDPGSSTTKLVPVTVTGKVTDNAGVSTVGYAVTDEYGQSQPSGTITLKDDGSYSFTVSLPASRRDTDKDGRKFTITVTARDVASNEASKSVVVTVPHNQGKK